MPTTPECPPDAQTSHPHHPPNVIFLDIDGVLQPLDSHERSKHDIVELQERLSTECDEGYRDLSRYDIAAVYYDWDQEAVANLKALCDQTPAKIVISSAWREFSTLEELKLLFRIQDLDRYVVGVTPELSRCTRDIEVEDYLLNRPAVQRFVVLDDAYLPNFKRRFPREFVYCQQKLDAECYEQAASVLTRPPGNEAEEAEALFDGLVANAAEVTTAELPLDKISVLKRRRRYSIAKFMDLLCEGLATNTCLEHLTVSGFGHDVPLSSKQQDQLALQLGTALRANRSVRHLDISDNYLEGIGDFFSSLSQREQPLAALSLRDNRLDSESQKALAGFLREVDHPMELDLKECCLEFERDLVEAIGEASSVSVVAYATQANHLRPLGPLPGNLALERGGRISLRGL